MIDPQVMPAATAAGMTGEELRMRMEHLGLDPRALARLLAISDKSARDMLTGKMRIPPGVAREVLELADLASTAVGDVITTYADDPTPIPLHQDEQALAAAVPSLAGWTPRAWRAIVWRALQELPAGRAVYANSGAQEGTDG